MGKVTVVQMEDGEKDEAVWTGDPEGQIGEEDQGGWKDEDVRMDEDEEDQGGWKDEDLWMDEDVRMEEDGQKDEAV